MNTVSDNHCGQQPLDINKHCDSEGCCQIDDDANFISYRENKSPCDVQNGSRSTNLHSAGVDRCCLEECNCRQSSLATCRVASSSAETRTDISDLDDNVRWFFDDTSDADVGHDRQNAADVFRSLSSVDEIADVDLKSNDKIRRITPPMCDSLPLTRDADSCVMPTLNAVDVLDKDDRSDCSDQCISESLLINNSQELSNSAASNTNNCASGSGSAEPGKCHLSNAIKPNSNNHKLLLARNLQQMCKETTDKKSAATLPRCDLSTASEGAESSFPPPVVDWRNFKKRSSDNKVPNKHSLHNSRILVHSRHFQSIQNAIKIMNGVVRDCELQPAAVLSNDVSLNLQNDETSDNDRLSEIGQSCEPQPATERAVGRACGKTEDRELGYFSRLKKLGMCLSHGDDELMCLAIEICQQQLALNPTQTWLVYLVILLYVGVISSLPSNTVSRPPANFINNFSSQYQPKF